MLKGTFSEVFLLKDNFTGDLVVGKVEDIEVGRLEANTLKKLVGVPGVVQFIGLMEHEDNSIILMHPILSNTKHYRPKSIEELKSYYDQLLITLDRIHNLGITHGDIKPSNVLYEESTKTVYIIDFDLSFTGSMIHEYGTKGYRAPEILNSEICTNKIDMWSLGAMFTNDIFKDDLNEIELIEIAYLLVSKDPLLIEFINEHKSELLTVEALDLISKLLVTDPNIRQSASQALLNIFFYKKTFGIRR